MTGLYAADAASARADVGTAGASVTFTLAGQGTYDPLTDTTTPGADVVITGAAVRVKGNPIVYQRLSLIEGEAPTLFFTPDNYGDVPALDAVVTWGGIDYTVKSVDPIAPDGVAIAARVVVAR